MLLTALALFATACGSNNDLGSAPEELAFSSDISIECNRRGVKAFTTEHEISNVVVKTTSGDEIKFDGLSGYEYFAKVDDAVGAWVKSANNHSGDGSGYGEWFSCFAGTGAPADPEPEPTEEPVEESAEPVGTGAPAEPTPTATPEPELGDPRLIESASGISVYCADDRVDVTTTQHDISNIVVALDGDVHVKYDNLSGSEYTITKDGVSNVWVKSGDNASGEGPGYGEPFDCFDARTQAGAATLFFETEVPAVADVVSSDSGIAVVCTVDSVHATTDRHEISNIVVATADGTHTKFNALSGYEFSIDMSDVVTVWVKSADNASGDGPGYGERFDCTLATEGELEPVVDGTGAPIDTVVEDPAEEAPEIEIAPVTSDSGIAVACLAGTVHVTTSVHAISNVVVERADGVHVKYDGLSGMSYSIEEPNALTVWVKSGDNASDDGPGYGERFSCEYGSAEPATPSEGTGDVEPTPAPPAEVLDETDGRDPADTGIRAECMGDAVLVTTMDHDISNVVVELWDGTHVKYDNLSGKEFTVDQAGVVNVWVKSADNASGDGPGYGEKLTCVETDPGTGEVLPVEPAPVEEELGLDASDTGITVVCTAGAVSVETTDHDISNIVVSDAADNHTKYDGLSGKTYTVDQAGVVTVWVKSADNASGDGPGYGERFDCSFYTAPADADKGRPARGGTGGEEPVPAPVDYDLVDASGIFVACTANAIYVDTTVHDISNIVVELSDGSHVKYDNLSGKSYTVGETGVVAVWVKSGDNASGDGPGYGEKFGCRLGT